MAIAAGLVLVVVAAGAQAQGVRVPVPYDAQLKTDPDVGNVQGIQRYGRPLKTDPDQGEGYSYHVYPVAHEQPQLLLIPPFAPPSGGYSLRADAAGELPATLRRAILGDSPLASAREIEATIAKLTEDRERSTDPAVKDQLSEQIGAMREKLAALNRVQSGANSPDPQQSAEHGLAYAGVALSPAAAGGPYPSPFDWTAGLRNAPLPLASGTPFPESTPFEAQAGVITRDGLTYTEGQIYQQPLIQIKMRVIEVARTDGLTVGSILEYVSAGDQPNSRTSGHTANRSGTQGAQNFRGLTRFLVPDLITNASTGTGSLINLTSEHINWLVQMLAVETNADVITAPEVVTLNGQNVEFVAGEKLPFALGQNVIQGTNNNIQQVFYKHVGTMVSVTPRIVNWGLHGEGRGEAALSAHEIADWPKLIQFMQRSQLPFTIVEFRKRNNEIVREEISLGDLLAKYADPNIIAIPYSVQNKVLRALNDYSKSDPQLRKRLQLAEVIHAKEQCAACDTWVPENCTVDLSVVVRLADPGTVNLGSDTDLGSVTTTERNVRAVANVIQIQSGHGVVMAGLIGEREIDDQAKVPLLGDLPAVGFLFRSKAVTRVKTEVLVFVEAEVLPSAPQAARAKSSQDFLLGQPYVDGEFLENPLEVGMYRVGFGTYLPPHSHGEQIFWEQYGRKVRKMHAHFDDAVRP
jgi:hypothetical protein